MFSGRDREQPGDTPPEWVDGARHRVNRNQATALAVVAVVLALGLLFSPVTTLRCLIIGNLVIAGGFLAMRLAAVAAALLGDNGPDQADIDAKDLPLVTLLCPLYREPHSVGNLVKALSSLRYPRDKLEVILLIEADDNETGHGIPSLPCFIRVEIVPPGLIKTKPHALNHGLKLSRGSVIGVYDAEDRPEPDQLLKVVGTFKAGAVELSCVQAQLNYYNRDDGLITRSFALEYAFHFDWFLPGLSRLGLPLPLGGTSNFVKREALLEAGGWDAFNVTEDADLGLRLAERGGIIRTVTSTTYEEATDTPGRWIRQRSRWLKGFLQTWFVHTRRFTGIRAAIVLHLALGAVVLCALINPITWTLFFLWLGGAAPFLGPLFDGGLGAAAQLLLIGGTAAHLWFMILAPVGRGWYDLTSAALFLPIYWLLQSVAAYKALVGFILQPHYWEKTDHSAGDDPAREPQNA